MNFPMPFRTCALNVDINVDTQSNIPYTSPHQLTPHQLTPHQYPPTPHSSSTPLPALQQREFYPGSVSRHLSLSKAFLTAWTGMLDGAVYAYMGRAPFHGNFSPGFVTPLQCRAQHRQRSMHLEQNDLHRVGKTHTCKVAFGFSTNSKCPYIIQHSLDTRM